MHDVLDARGVADLIHLPLSTVFEYARRGLIRAHKLGRRWIFNCHEVEAAVCSAPSRLARTPSLRIPSVRSPHTTGRQLPLPFDNAA